MDVQELLERMQVIADNSAKHYMELEKDKRHTAYDKVSEACMGITARQLDLERLLKQYQDECAKSSVSLKAGLDRLYLLMQGDALSPGILSQQQEQYKSLSTRLDNIESSQVESRKHRVISMDLKDELADVRKDLDKLLDNEKTRKTELKAFKKFTGWTIAIVNGGWIVGVTIYDLLKEIL